MHGLPPIARSLLRSAGSVAMRLPWLGRLRTATETSLADPALTSGLDDARDALARFGRESDEDFTTLARGLSELDRRLAAIQGETRHLQAVLEDRDEEQTIRSAIRLYQTSVDLVHSSTGTAAIQQQQMQRIEDSLLRACKAREQFHQNHLLLRILTMCIRMEASRVDPEYQSVFLNVAAAIAEIDEKIERSTASAFGRIESIVQEARAERLSLGRLERELHASAQQSMQTVEREVARLQAALAPCAEEGRAIAQTFEATQSLTLAVIGSLQHQDIVRQRLEHVSDGFRDLRDHLRPDGTADDVAFVHHAARVQRAHLQSARAEIDRAADGVVSGLRALLAEALKLAEQFVAFEEAASAAFTGCRLAELYRGEISNLAGIADRSGGANERLGRLVERIDEIVRVFSREVIHYDLDVKIVALNAQIAAARVPSADALNKLAEETSLIAEKNATVTHELSAELQTSLTELHQVEKESAEFVGIITREKGQFETGLARESERLTALATRVTHAAQSNRAAFGEAHRAAGEMLDRLSFPTLIAACFDPAEALCAALDACTATHAARTGLSDEATARLEAHRVRYTMEKENATHTATLAATPAVTASAAAAAAASAPAVIELFDPPAAPSHPPPADASPSPAAPPPSDDPKRPDLGPGIDLF